ncbi:class I SAM-dependent methyltransferase [Micromonospora sp. PLK6-60]|uniref:class I SAM-dependent DNA methyltransferase n=1 Tax=Micromonospora sp. PLK6-60 TaxID=2873383 RepID=UPI001CA68862|nr:class I SAM-dependent methyltransferase [Micromonospora sp. PLK6-60]MBY8870724.1 class I SAM-dependent methyltransferase [Micromonospora sp. PLK6-60]
MYDSEVAEIWDTIYRGRGRDYAAEARSVAEVIRERHPDAGSLLDVACGTGEHLRHFDDLFDHVEGLELSGDMIEAGRGRSPWLTMHQADMRSFALGRRFDAITCLFSSIGHAHGTAELDATLARFAAHLNPGGVVVVEPWWFPETFADGYVTGDVVRTEGRVIGRVSHSRREGAASRVSAHFTVADADTGLRHFTEDLLISLFTREQYEDAFRRAGGTVELLDGGPSGRGLFVGVWR